MPKSESTPHNTPETITYTRLCQHCGTEIEQAIVAYSAHYADWEGARKADGICEKCLAKELDNPDSL